MNEIFSKSLIKTLIIILLVGLILLLALEGAFESYEIFKKFLEEFIIVIIAALVVSAFFEFRLRKEISEEFNRFLELNEEFGKAGIVKYYSNFKDIDFRPYFNREVNSVDIYVTYGATFFKSIEDKLESMAYKTDVNLNIYLMSKENPFISGLGNLWGRSDSSYNEDGIKSNIDKTCDLLKGLFSRLKGEGKLKARIQICLLKRHPVFYSFYRFDDEMIYTPSKVIEPKTFVPIAFIVRKTSNSEGIYNKCMFELNNIKNDSGALEIIFNSEDEKQ